MDYEELRRLLVETQLIPRRIRDQRVIKAMLKVPRHLFVDEPLQYKAYDDMALPIGDGQTISQPYMVAVMTEFLELKGNERVLEVGTGSGYQAAILAELAAEVFSIERMERLALRARERLRNLGYDNVHVITGDGTAGLPEKAPFDRIIITAGTPQIPEPIREQLADNSILVAPVGARFSQQLIRLRKEKGKITEEYHTPCVFVPLVGEYGWKE
ncbi:MAG: protein-L-isoaspartate O-methyltransferase [bacterium]|nr:MAG: protein-L-isoaspartate O-methyltransferase [bacterium]